MRRLKSWQERLDAAKKWTPKTNHIVRIWNREFGIESLPDKDSIIDAALSEYHKLWIDKREKVSWVSGKDVNIVHGIPKTVEQLKRIYEKSKK